MLLPKDLIEEVKITRGFTFSGIFPGNSKIPHICIVINSNVIDGQTVYYVFMTSKVEKARILFKKDIDALVELEEDEYRDYFPEDRLKETCIQCDVAHLEEITQSELLEKLSNGDAVKANNVKNSVIEKITFAIENSITYDEDDRKRILN
ncbi:MAG: hypothetical protein GY754_40610 [bacterium]|nr:hypothetical protein [bacterium]